MVGEVVRTRRSAVKGMVIQKFLAWNPSDMAEGRSEISWGVGFNERIRRCTSIPRRHAFCDVIYIEGVVCVRAFGGK